MVQPMHYRMYLLVIWKSDLADETLFMLSCRNIAGNFWRCEITCWFPYVHIEPEHEQTHSDAYGSVSSQNTVRPNLLADPTGPWAILYGTCIRHGIDPYSYVLMPCANACICGMQSNKRFSMVRILCHVQRHASCPHLRLLQGLLL